MLWSELKWAVYKRVPTDLNELNNTSTEHNDATDWCTKGLHEVAAASGGSTRCFSSVFPHDCINVYMHCHILLCYTQVVLLFDWLQLSIFWTAPYVNHMFHCDKWNIWFTVHEHLWFLTCGFQCFCITSHFLLKQIMLTKIHLNIHKRNIN